LLEKVKHYQQNKEYIQLKKKQEREDQYKNKLKQDKIKYNNTYLDAPYRSVNDSKFEDLLKINIIKDTYKKEKEEIVEQ
jgi:hypothetical protein